MTYYYNKNFTRKDVVNISIDTSSAEELFDYVGVKKEYVRINHSELDYESKEKEKDKDKDKDKDDFDVSR